MARTTITIKVENGVDFVLAEQGIRSHQDIRSVELEALVDTGASLLCLPKSDIEKLGLNKIAMRRVTTANGQVNRGVYGNARLTVLSRTCTLDVIALPEDTPALLGYIPLENLDLTIDPTNETLNPAHGDEVVLDLY